MKRTITRMAVAVMMVIAAYGHSAQAAGTAANTVLSSTAQISAAGGVTSVTSSTNTTVAAVFGLTSINETGAPDKSIAAGATGSYTFAIRNNANTSDTVKANLGSMVFSAGAGTTGNWAARIDDHATFSVGTALNWATSTNTFADHGGDTAASSTPIGPGAYATFTIEMAVPSDASNGSTMQAKYFFSISTATATAYTSAFNGSAYGGSAQVLRTVGTGNQGASFIKTTVQAAILSLTKAAAITSPGGGYGGAAGTPAPGAKITYTLTYGNTGTAAASTVVIADPIPANTTYSTGTIQLNGVGKSDGVGDECDFNVTTVGKVTCTITTLGAGTVGQTVTYDVTIN